MSKLKTLIKMAKAIVSGEKFAEAKLKDGSVVSYIDEIKVGSEIYLLDENGEEIVLADGEYETEDGIKFEIKDGIVSSIEGQEAPASEEVEIEAESEDEENVKDENKAYVDEQIGGLASKIDSLQAQIDSLKEQLDSAKSEAQLSKTALTKLSKAVEIIGNESVNIKPEQKQVEGAPVIKQDRAQKLEKWFK